MKRILTCEDIGMKCCMHNMCVFTQFGDETNERVIVLLWVDDIIITGNTLSIVERIISCIEANVKKISNLGEITRYIGIDLKKDRINHTLELTQSSVIAKFGPNLKTTSVPLNPYHDYRAKNEDKLNPPLRGEHGSLRYLSDRTKPTLQLLLSLLQKHPPKKNDQRHRFWPAHFFETFLRCFHCDWAAILKIKDFILMLTYHNLKLISNWF